jgi:hypothetical protein
VDSLAFTYCAPTCPPAPPPPQSTKALLRGLTIKTHTSLFSGRQQRSATPPPQLASSHPDLAGLGAAAQSASSVQSSVLEPCNVLLEHYSSNGQQDLKLDVSDIRLKVGACLNCEGGGLSMPQACLSSGLVLQNAQCTLIGPDVLPA